MSGTVAVYRWEFRRQDVTHACYAEARLENVGRPGDDRWIAQVLLLRDEMPQPKPREVIDPEKRVGKRVFVGVCTDYDLCRELAYLAPVEGARRAYTMIFRTLQENPDAVERFGDAWLTQTIAEFNHA